MRAGEEVCRRREREGKIQRENRYQRKMRKRERQREIQGENIATAITEAEILSLWNSCSHSVTDRYMWIYRDTQKPTFTHTVYFHYWLLIDFFSQRWEDNNNCQLFSCLSSTHTIMITLHGESICYDCFVHTSFYTHDNANKDFHQPETHQKWNNVALVSSYNEHRTPFHSQFILTPVAQSEERNDIDL